MKIRKIILYNFRNHQTLNLTFNKNLVILTGKNATGKTNILEAIYFLSTGTSFRTHKTEALISIGSDFLKINSEIETQEGNFTFEVEILRDGKSKRKVNSQTITKVTDFIGKIKSVVFYIKDIDIISGEPEKRRNFLDNEIPQIRPPYYFYLRRFYHALSQRNKLLKDIKERRETQESIDTFDIPLAEAGAYIIEKRLEFIKSLSYFIDHFYKEIGQQEDSLKINYIPSVPISCEENRNKIKDIFIENLKKTQLQDIELGRTSIGPQKDDIEFYLGDRNLRYFGSLGEQKTMSLCLRLAEIKYIQERFKDTPIILFDDLFSELDRDRICSILNLLLKIEDSQIFITSTEIPSNININMQNCEIFEM